MVYGTSYAGTLVNTALKAPRPVSQLQIKLMSESYAVIPNLLSREPVEPLRRPVTQYLKKGGNYKHGGKFQLHAMYVLEDVAIVLNGEYDLMINATSYWHNDVPHHPASRDGSIFSDENFRVYKIAFYLQERKEDAQTTLKIRPRSHLKGRTQSMPDKPIAVKAGDAIVFDVRIEHSGELPSLINRAARKVIERIGPWLHLDAQKTFIPTRTVIRRAKGIPDRVAIFMTFSPAETWSYSYGEEGRNLHLEVYGKLSAGVMKRLAPHKIASPFI